MMKAVQLEKIRRDGPPVRDRFRAWSSALASVVLAACANSPSTLHLGAAAPAVLSNPALFRQTLSETGGPAGAPGAGAALREADRDAPSARAIAACADELVGARLDRAGKEALAWRVERDVSTPPVLAPGVVAFGSGDRLVALSPETGQELWKLPAGGAALLALAASADQTALLLADRRGQRWIGVYNRAGRERLRVSADAALGAPALLGGTLLVPTGDGFVSAVDVAAPAERARVRLGSSPVHALWMDGNLFFGGPPWISPTGSLPEQALPRRPLPEPVARGAADVALTPMGVDPLATRLYVAPEREGTGSGGVYMATYGRIAFGLERDRGTLEWVIALPGRVLSAAPVAGGFALCEAAGSVQLVGARTGRVERRWQLVRERRGRLGEPALRGCALSAGRVLGPDPEREGAPPPPLLEQLASVLRLSDPALTEAQRFLSRELAARPEPEATRVLIELVMRRSLDRRLEAEAEDLLATRRVGRDHMLAALSESGGRGEEALPPIAPLGEALAALGERRAAPLLARQLNRPAHAAAALARAAVALEALASTAEYAELSVFFSLHRTNADDAPAVAAVLSVARTLLRIGGPKARQLLEFAMRDPLTLPEVKHGIEGLLASSATSCVDSKRLGCATDLRG